jgi:hypothetical protein
MKKREIRNVVGYEGLYAVDKVGNIYDAVKGTLRNPWKTPSGYLNVELVKDGIRKKFGVHRLVAEAFIGEIGKGMQIDHKNGVRDDNRACNLRIVTTKENARNPITMRRKRKAAMARAKKLTLTNTIDGSKYEFDSRAEANLFFNYKGNKIGEMIAKAIKDGKDSIRIGIEFKFS